MGVHLAPDLFLFKICWFWPYFATWNNWISHF